MAVPLFVLQNERDRIYKQRRLLENMSEFEIRKHTGLPYWGARELLEWLEPAVEPLSLRNRAISSETKVLTAMGFFRSGTFQYMMGTVSGSSQATCSRVIEQVSNAIVEKARELIRFPDTEEGIRQIMHGFYRVAEIPNVIGLVDGSHVNMKAPTENSLVFINRKQRYSINAQLICNHESYFMDVVAKWPGSSHDSFIFRQSSVSTRFENGEFGNRRLIGDSGYFATNYMIVPHNRRNIDPLQANENRVIARTRSSVERAIGLWKCRFRSMHNSGGDLCYDPAKVCKFIISTTVLHNFCLKRQIPILAEDEEDIGEILAQEI